MRPSTMATESAPGEQPQSSDEDLLDRSEVVDESADDADAAPVVRVRPEQTSDDTDAGWGERGDENGHDRWLHEQRPPHWE